MTGEREFPSAERGNDIADKCLYGYTMYTSKRIFSIKYISILIFRTERGDDIADKEPGLSRILVY